MKMSTSSRELRCPLPHPKFGDVGSPCNKLLLRYEPGTVGVVQLDCRRCLGRVILSIRSTSTST